MQDNIFMWAIWAEWPAGPELTLAAGATRIAECLKLIRSAIPHNTEAFKIGDRGKRVLPVDDPALADHLVPGLKASRNRDIFTKNSLEFGDASVLLFPTGPFGLSVQCQQFAGGTNTPDLANYYEGRFELRAQGEYARVLADDADTVSNLVADLAAVLDARNAWVDMTHVRQDWNQWKRDCPVYGWATWLHPGFATVDTAGLDVDTRPAGDGTRITLRVDPVAMADDTGTVGKTTIRELALRTVLADGRRLLDVNDMLREADDPPEADQDPTMATDPASTEEPGEPVTRVRRQMVKLDDQLTELERLLSEPFPAEEVTFTDADGTPSGAADRAITSPCCRWARRRPGPRPTASWPPWPIGGARQPNWISCPHCAPAIPSPKPSSTTSASPARQPGRGKAGRSVSPGPRSTRTNRSRSSPPWAPSETPDRHPSGPATQRPNPQRSQVS
jgi:hypothetical protein